MTPSPGITPQADGPLLGLFRRRRKADHRPRRDRPAERDRACRRPMSDAWFCTDPDGHFQATGIDARGRKQYRYHPDFRAKRGGAQISTACSSSARRCRKLRRRVEQDLKRRKLDARNGARRRRPAARHRAYPRRQRAICAATTRASARRRCAAATCSARASKLTMRFTGKHGIVHEVTDHRHAT